MSRVLQCDRTDLPADPTSASITAGGRSLTLHNQQTSGNRNVLRPGRCERWQQRCQGLSLSLFSFLKVGRCFSPETVSSQQVSASLPELWRLSQSARHLKDLDLQLSKSGRNCGRAVASTRSLICPGAVQVSLLDYVSFRRHFREIHKNSGEANKSW